MQLANFDAMDALLEKFNTNLNSLGFKPKEHQFLLGISGGADSVFCAHMLSKLGYPFEMAHVNYQLRGKESDNEEIFVQSLAKKLHCFFHVLHLSTNDLDQQKNLSLQMWARVERMRFFEHIRAQNHLHGIVLGNHMTDRVETFFINLLRGSGAKGLGGFSMKNNFLIRPCIDISANEIRQYLSKNGIDFKTDSSNAKPDYLRNKIRLQLLPVLENFKENYLERIAANMDSLKDSELLLKKMLERENLLIWDPADTSPVGCIKLADLNLLPSPSFVLYCLMKPYGFNRKDCEEILLAKGSGKTKQNKDWILTRDRNHLFLNSVLPQQIFAKTITLTHPLKSNLTIKTPLGTLKISVIPNNKICFDAKNDRIYLPLSIQGSLTIRNWEKGDFIIPLGMKGRKKVSDVLIDQKVPQNNKTHTLVLEKDAKIVWIPGFCTSNEYKIRSEEKFVYCLEIIRL